jgi:4-amino-4-deoxy-L-arabinose transferase-like glycosyltransferase
VIGTFPGDAPESGATAWRHATAFATAALFVGAMITASLSPLFDPDESYYPGTAAESVDAGRGWDPRFNGSPRWDKPILTYALIEVSFAAFGRTAAAARVPSAVQSTLLVLIVGITVGRLAGRRAGGLSAIVVATTLGTQIFARVAHPEIGVVLMITTAELLAVAWLTTTDSALRRRLALGIGVALGLGVLTKGPVAVVLPLVALLPARLIAGGPRPASPQAWRHGALTAAVMLTVAVPWYAAMSWQHGTAFLEEALWQHNVGRYTGAAFTHRAAPWFLVAPTLLAMFPWTAFVPGALWRVSRRDRTPAGTLRVYMAVAACSAFIFYSASASKLPHYALAIVPPLAVLIGLYLDDLLSGTLRPRAVFRWTSAGIAATSLALACVPLVLNRAVRAQELFGALSGVGSELSSVLARAVWPAALLLVVSASVTATAGKRRALASIAFAGAVVPTVFVLSAKPLLQLAYPWERFGREIQGTNIPVWLIGPRAPSLTFYSRLPVVRLTDAEADEPKFPATEGWIVARAGWIGRCVAPACPISRIHVVDQHGAMMLAFMGREAPREDP